MSQAVASIASPAAIQARPATAVSPGEPGSARTGLPVAAAIAPNPRLSFDNVTGLAVIEFRSSDGETETLPTSRELAAYKRAVLSGGERPAGMGVTAIRVSLGD